jgi:hypothetical protein
MKENVLSYFRDVFFALSCSTIPTLKRLQFVNHSSGRIRAGSDSANSTGSFGDKSDLPASAMFPFLLRLNREQLGDSTKAASAAR